MESLKRGLGYFCLVILYGLIIYEGLKIQAYLQEQMAINFQVWPSLMFFVVFPALIGILFSLPSSIRKLKGDGSWEIDWILLCSITLPTMLLAASPILYFLTPLGKLVPFGILFTKNSDLFFFLSGLVSGYSMLNSFKKSRHIV